MSYEYLSAPGDVITRPAGSDLSAKQYFGVKISGANLALCSVAGEAHYGVLQNKPSASGQAGAVAVRGISRAFAGGTIAVGGKCTMDANGKYVAGFGADQLCGIADQSAVATDIFPMRVADGSGFCQHAPSERSYTFDLANIANGDVLVALSLADFVNGARIKRVSAVVTKAVTTGAKLATLTPKLTGVALTGGVLALTSANCTPIGTEVAGTAITGLNTGLSTDTFTLTASIVTPFIEGQISVKIEFA